MVDETHTETEQQEHPTERQSVSADVDRDHKTLRKETRAFIKKGLAAISKKIGSTKGVNWSPELQEAEDIVRQTSGFFEASASELFPLRVPRIPSFDNMGIIVEDEGTDVAMTSETTADGEHLDALTLLSRRIRETPKTSNPILPHKDVNDTGEAPKAEQREFTTPNEETLYKLAPYINDTKGTIISAGSDQGLQLLAMCPEAERLRVVDIDPHATTVNYFYLESATRFKQLMQREPTSEELIALYSNRDLTLALLHLPAQEAYQHAFTQSELATINSLLIQKTGNTTFLSYLSRQNEVNDFFWMKKEYLPRILTAYESGNINIHRGNITKGEVMNSIAQSDEEIGLVYLSNIVNRGYLFNQDIDNLRTTMQALNLSPDCHFVNAVSNVNLPGISTRKLPPSKNDWPYLLQDTASFIDYADPNNPNIPQSSPWVNIRTPNPRTFMEHEGDGVYRESARTVVTTA